MIHEIMALGCIGYFYFFLYYMLVVLLPCSSFYTNSEVGTWDDMLEVMDWGEKGS